jgi:drug/metabolite transporter (DMT)-like permease
VNQSLTTGRWQLGLGLSLCATLLFGLLPIALKGLLTSLDAYTITWIRFLIAAMIMSVVVVTKQRLSFTRLNRSTVWLLILACGGLCSNYVLYLTGLRYLMPSSAQVLIQMAPILLLLGSLVLLGESFSPIQWVGLGLLLLGFVLFFNHRLEALFHQLTADTIGILLIVASALVWAVYGLAQKQLLQIFSPTTSMLIIYGVGTLILWPMAQPVQLLHLKGVLWLPLIFSASSTLLAYWTFAEALNHWPTPRVSAVLAMVPIVTVVAMTGSTVLWPDLIQPENLSLLSIGGLLLVVVGSMMSALGQPQYPV